jgi:hypothetical protein
LSRPVPPESLWCLPARRPLYVQTLAAQQCSVSLR